MGNSGFDPHGTTILSVRIGGTVAMGGDGQVTVGNTIMKGNARKVRRLYGDKVIAGFAGGTADAFTLFERFEGKLEKYGNLTRAAIELAKDWRTDRALRRLADSEMDDAKLRTLLARRSLRHPPRLHLRTLSPRETQHLERARDRVMNFPWSQVRR